MIHDILSICGIIILLYIQVFLSLCILWGLVEWSGYFHVSTPYIELVYTRKWYILNLLSTFIIFIVTCIGYILCAYALYADQLSIWNTYINSEVII